ncbi:thymidine phosphorylase [Nonomuraea sp. NPDC049400]|uniref:thymidine phosphorylase n=1 Tax=Nonomuraea sp. NPDC049400 TaxID=3364352 RepID=UPI0037B096A6
MTDVLAAIASKRAGEQLTAESISGVIDAYTRGTMPDYQMAAWLMAVACRGMSFDEVVALTRSYVDSGMRLGYSGVGRSVVDKHSTGGVGDKTTMIVAPVLAALGIPIAKISGRGLGFAGGTLDKLESIPGLRLALDEQEILHVLSRAGMVVVQQSKALVPADGATYALRDVTGTVESLPLIAASIMSKKIAASTNGVVLDVKFGSGALTGHLADAIDLAELMIDIGAAFGLRCHAVISSMNQPLGRASGNVLEVREAIEVLNGAQMPGVTELSAALAAEAMILAGDERDPVRAEKRVREVLLDGRALSAFRRWVSAQGGDPAVITDPDQLDSAPYVTTVNAETSGWIQRMDARAIGALGLHLGAGRLAKDAPIDRAVGVVLHKRVGDRVARGEPIADIHLRDADAEAQTRFRSAVTVVNHPVAPEPTIHAVIRPLFTQENMGGRRSPSSFLRVEKEMTLHGDSRGGA